jgi:putative ABC transport system permease protein
MSFYLQAILLGLGLSALSMGIFISMKIFNIPDITTDGSYTLGAVVTALTLSHHLPLIFVFLLSFLGSAMAGAITGYISTYLRVNPLLAGILVMTALYSINLSLMGRSNIPLINVKTVFNFWSPNQENPGLELFTFGFIILVIAVLIILLLKTDFGIAMRATGNSETMVRSMGVNTSRMKILGLALANGLIGISGFLVAQYQGFADINMGIGIVITGLGSVVMSDSLWNLFPTPPIEWQVFGVILGAILFQLILGLALSLGVDPNMLKLITALLVLMVVSLPVIKLNFYGSNRRGK